MPNFRDSFGHRNTIMALTIAIAPTALLDLRNLVIVAGCLSGLCISPDWDLNPNAMGLIGRIGFVDEYAELVPHRHKISHTPVVGTIIRFVLTFAIPYIIMGGIFGYWLPLWVIWRLFAGLCAADALHISLDRIFTCVKKYLGRHRRRKRRKRGFYGNKRR